MAEIKDCQTLNIYFRQNLIRKNYNSPKPVVFLTFKEESEIKGEIITNPYESLFPISNENQISKKQKRENFPSKNSSFAESEKLYIAKNQKILNEIPVKEKNIINSDSKKIENLQNSQNLKNENSQNGEMRIRKV